MDNVEFTEPILQPHFAVMIFGCGVVLSVILLCEFSFKKGWFSRRLFPCEKRKPVSWFFPDVCVIFFLHIFLCVLCAKITQDYLLPGTDRDAEQIVSLQFASLHLPDELSDSGHDDLRKEHPLTILMIQGKKKPSILLVCFLMAVVAAPLCEEFLFRVVLQGYLQSLEESLRRNGLFFFKGIPRGFVSVFIVALIFSLIHWRDPASKTMLDPNILFYQMVAQMTANLATVLLGIVYLVVLRNGSLSELGIVSTNMKSDLRGAAIVYAMIIIPMLMIQNSLNNLAPEMVADPITLMVLAMMLGILFFRTNRFLPVLSLHMIFNAVSFTLLMLFA